MFFASGGNTATSDQMAMVISEGHGFNFRTVDLMEQIVMLIQTMSSSV